MLHETPTLEINVDNPLSKGFDDWQQRIERLDREISDYAGTGQFPDWWTSSDGMSIYEVDALLKTGKESPDFIPRYVELNHRQQQLNTIITGYESYNTALQDTIYRLGVDVVADGFMAEQDDGFLHRTVLSDLGKDSDVFDPELSLLKKVYNTDSGTALLGARGDEFSDKLRSALLQPLPMKWIRYSERQRSNSGDIEWAQELESIRQWMSQAVEAATGMPADEAFDYVFSASRFAANADEYTIDIINKINYFGIDRIRRIAAFSDIHGLEAYTTEQLERMDELVADPAATAERLANHDVMIVMTNRFGERDGALHNAAENFDDGDRTLFFEITKLEDIFRHMIKLGKIGIQPSTLALASHSAPGQFMVSDSRELANGNRRRDILTVAGRKLIALANESATDKSDQGYSTQGMKGLARLLNTYMQPSRGIDDVEDDQGRIKLIFQACYMAAEVKASDLDDAGNKIESGLESVTGKLGKDLIESGVMRAIDIYGASTAIQMHATEAGVRYSASPKGFEIDTSARPHQPAHRVRIENGTFSEQDVDEIILRRPA